MSSTTKKNSPRERREVLAEELVEMGVDSLLISNPKHVFYLTGVPSNLNFWLTIMKGPRSTSFLLLENSGKAHFLFGASEISNPWKGEGVTDAAKKAFDVDVSTYTDYDLQQRMITYADVLGVELKKWLTSLRSGGVRMNRLGIEEWHLAAAYRDAASRASHAEQLPGFSQSILSMRKTKGKDEIQHLKRATEVITFGYRYAKEHSLPGRSEDDLFREVNYRAFKRYGAFVEVIGDYATGERSLNVGGWPTDRKLKRGDTVVLDLQAASNNYWSDLCRTFVVGKPSQKQLSAWATIMSAKKRAEEVMRPGTKGREVYRAVNDELTRGGFPSLTHHAGHTIGLDDQEPPWFLPNEEGTLEEGCVAVVEPGVYVPATGGIRIEDAYLITRKGCEKISKFPYGLN